ncbi:BgTH12-06059 [Blumeria graminis f. sp. triticale]|uniref:BgTH12-06059 n=1 Tax=Blumeria graminis f. sp. triticale TaxID=1689686 RepID=A0A9W4D535_BLUGR|nr:BgTH12-06059 [Blumeria graminis f. sp. triticale]
MIGIFPMDTPNIFMNLITISTEINGSILLTTTMSILSYSQKPGELWA